MFPQYFWAFGCDLLKLRPQKSRLAVLSFLLAIPSLLLAQTSAQISPQEELNRHYQAARTFGVVGDLDHAAVEYRAFLSQALHQMANAKTNRNKILRRVRIKIYLSHCPERSDALTPPPPK